MKGFEVEAASILRGSERRTEYMYLERGCSQDLAGQRVEGAPDGGAGGLKVPA